MKKILLLISVLLAFLNLNAQINPDQKSKVDSLFQVWDNDNSPGLALGMVKDGGLIYARGYGIADLEHDIPITPSTVFYIASVSKQFVTFCILLLEEQGKLSLDDEIQRYLPDFPRYQAPLTIRHFIHHTSGVRDNLTLWVLSGNDYLDHVDPDAIYELIKQQKILNFTPGDRYLYSNSCYFMLAMIVEKVSGLSIKDFAELHIFKPLGMKNSHFHNNHHHIIKNRAFSYAPSSDNGYNNLIMRYDLVGSGGLYSTVEDLFLWDQNFYNNELGKGNMEIMWKMHEEGLLNSGESSNYAFGLVNGTYRGLKTVGHGGSLAGYRTNLLRFPDQNFSVIILANVSDFNASGKAYQVADIMLEDMLKPESDGQEEEQPELNFIDLIIGKRKKNLSEVDLEDYVGEYYSSELKVTYRLFLQNDTLKSQIRYNDPWELILIDNDQFSAEETKFEFIRDSDEVVGFLLNAGRVQGIEFVKN